MQPGKERFQSTVATSTLYSSFQGQWNTKTIELRAINKEKSHATHNFLSSSRDLYRFYLNSSQRTREPVYSHRVYREVVTEPLQNLDLERRSWACPNLRSEFQLLYEIKRMAMKSFRGRKKQ
jgi:hypothetical protein